MTKPKIRFNNFKDEWKETKLNELVNSFDYGLNSSSKKYDGKNKYLRITDIDDETRLFKYDDLTTPNINLDDKSNYLLRDGNVVFARTGASTGKTYLYHDEDGKVYFAGFLIRADMNNFNDGSFIFYYTLTAKYNNFVKVNSIRSGQPGINSKELGSLKINTPSLNEQKKIGLLFSKIDKLINLKSKEISTLERVKLGYLQKLFADLTKNKPKIRFNNFKDEWKSERVGDISSKQIGGGTPKTSIKEYWHGSIPWFSSSDLSENDIFNVETNHYINEKAVKETVTKLVPKNSIAIVTRVGVGKLALINNEYSTSQDFVSLSKLKHNPLFLTYDLYLLIQKEKNKLQGTSIKGITKDFLLNLKINIPKSEKEQSKIADFMKLIDKQINLQQKELDRLKSLKKGYLQKMFV